MSSIPLLMSSSRFNPTSSGIGVTVPSVMMFAFVFYIGGYVGSYLSCVTNVRLMYKKG
jgi:hypothetical protein